MPLGVATANVWSPSLKRLPNHCCQMILQSIWSKLTVLKLGKTLVEGSRSADIRPLRSSGNLLFFNAFMYYFVIIYKIRITLNSEPVKAVILEVIQCIAWLIVSTLRLYFICVCIIGLLLFEIISLDNDYPWYL